MTTVLIILLMALGIYGFSKAEKVEVINSENGIQFFEGNFEQALFEAKAANKLVFVDVYAKWCGPCKLLKRTTFKDEEVGTYFNANFINIAVDGETKEGKELLRKYNVRSYPSLLIVDGDGEVKTRATGYHKPKALIDFGKRVNP